MKKNTIQNLNKYIMIAIAFGLHGMATNAQTTPVPESIHCDVFRGNAQNPRVSKANLDLIYSGNHNREASHRFVNLPVELRLFGTETNFTLTLRNPNNPNAPETTQTYTSTQNFTCGNEHPTFTHVFNYLETRITASCTVAFMRSSCRALEPKIHLK